MMPFRSRYIRTNDKRAELRSRKVALCGYVNNVLCFFRNRDPITKLFLMKPYCSSFYGSVLWDLSHDSLEDVCVIWRKGLRRVWDPLIMHTLSFFLLYVDRFF